MWLNHNPNPKGYCYALPKQTADDNGQTNFQVHSTLRKSQRTTGSLGESSPREHELRGCCGRGPGAIQSCTRLDVDGNYQALRISQGGIRGYRRSPSLALTTSALSMNARPACSRASTGPCPLSDVAHR